MRTIAAKRAPRRSSVYDWPLMLERLREFMSYQDMAFEMDVDASALRHIRRRDSCPRYDHGAWIVNEYRKHIGDDIPIC